MEYIIVNEQYAELVALIQLNRPKELNALNLQLMQELSRLLLPARILNKWLISRQ
jgi:enoyl-CoA hydratase/carnithine racemase